MSTDTAQLQAGPCKNLEVHTPVRPDLHALRLDEARPPMHLCVAERKLLVLCIACPPCPVSTAYPLTPSAMLDLRKGFLFIIPMQGCSLCIR